MKTPSMDKLITLNISGTKIECPLETLSLSGYFQGMPNFDTEIYINYDYKIFSHILSFLRDPQYQVPEKYEYALKFFIIPYSKSNLRQKQVQQCHLCKKSYIVHTTGENQWACKKCECIIDNCTSPKKGTLYCSLHKCKHCEELVINGSTGCANHLCSMNGCNKAKHSKYECCESHICHAYSCYNIKKTIDGEYCNKHTCVKGSCINFADKDVYFGSKYCKDHKCRCCANSKERDDYYCSEHSCQINDCDMCKSKEKSYCEFHQCEICDNSKERHNKYCNAHLCPIPNCGCDKEEEDTYCYDHKCIVCQNSKDVSQTYCTNHKCIINECQEMKIPNANYCTTHKCKQDNCNYLNHKGKQYCILHHCHYNKCISPAIAEGTYCIQHGGGINKEIKCNTINCHKYTRLNSAYCHNHKCKYHDCSNHRDNETYCKEHIYSA